MDGRTVRAVTLVIDKNPAPLAAVFRLSPDAGDPGIATRVRVNEYTDIRAVAEMDDGSLRAVSTVVKSAGGCSAPAVKLPDDAERSEEHTSELQSLMRISYAVLC